MSTLHPEPNIRPSAHRLLAACGFCGTRDTHTAECIADWNRRYAPKLSAVPLSPFESDHQNGEPYASSARCTHAVVPYCRLALTDWGVPARGNLSQCVKCGAEWYATV